MAAGALTMVGASKIYRYTLEGLVVVGALLVLAPIFIMVLTSFKPDAEIIHFESLLPRTPTLENYREILAVPEEIPLLRWLLNSLFISTSTTLLVLLVATPAAYALSRLSLPGARYVFALIVTMLMVPGQIMLVPMYLILNGLGWLDTPLALIVPAGAGVFGVFLLRQFFLGIPSDLEDAAAIDGCTRPGILIRIIVPLAKPALATLAIFTFMGSWNDFMGPLVFLDNVDKYTLPVGIALFQTSYYAEYGITLAAACLATAPALLVFVFFQRYIIEGIALTGLKE